MQCQHSRVGLFVSVFRKSIRRRRYENGDTLRNRQDEALFERYGKSQLVDVASGKVTPIGKPGL